MVELYKCPDTSFCRQTQGQMGAGKGVLGVSTYGQCARPWELWHIIEFIAAAVVQEIISRNFVLFGLPIALQPVGVRAQLTQLLDIDLLFPVQDNGLGTLSIKAGEVKCRAQSKCTR